MNEWISVNESIPNENKAVLVWCPEHENIYLAFVENGVWMYFGGPIAVCNDAVTHWMPIPEPPKENENRIGQVMA